MEALRLARMTTKSLPWVGTAVSTSTWAVRLALGSSGWVPPMTRAAPPGLPLSST